MATFYGAPTQSAREMTALAFQDAARMRESGINLKMDAVNRLQHKRDLILANLAQLRQTHQAARAQAHAESEQRRRRNITLGATIGGAAIAAPLLAPGLAAAGIGGTFAGALGPLATAAPTAASYAAGGAIGAGIGGGLGSAYYTGDYARPAAATLQALDIFEYADNPYIPNR